MINSKIKHPLVSIVVITYNSSQYVLETLESTKNQTYKNIELIISDDASNDNTIEICNEWLTKNQQCFVDAKILTSKINTGISANCNRGLQRAKGEWIKYIAGDDLLLENCIADNIQYIINHEEARFIFSNVIIRKSDNTTSLWLLSKKRFNKSAQDQFLYILKNISSFTSTPSSFMYLKTLKKLGGFNTDYPNFEDQPLWFNITKNGYKLHLLDQLTVLYRKHDFSVSENYVKNKDGAEKFFKESFKKFFKEIKLKELHRRRLCLHYLSTQIFICVKELSILYPKYSKILYFLNYISPIFTIRKIKQVIRETIN
ncbi:glycosyltransferase family 2 protein [Bacteroidota bacterium]